MAELRALDRGIDGVGEIAVVLVVVPCEHDVDVGDGGRLEVVDERVLDRGRGLVEFLGRAAVVVVDLGLGGGARPEDVMRAVERAKVVGTHNYDASKRALEDFNLQLPGEL